MKTIGEKEKERPLSDYSFDWRASAENTLAQIADWEYDNSKESYFEQIAMDEAPFLWPEEAKAILRMMKEMEDAASGR